MLSHGEIILNFDVKLMLTRMVKVDQWSLIVERWLGPTLFRRADHGSLTVSQRLHKIRLAIPKILAEPVLIYRFPESEG